MSTSSSAWPLAREIAAVVLVVIGVPLVVVITIVIGNWWLVGAEAMVVLGLALGVRRTPPSEPAPQQDVQVTIIEHDKPH